MTMRHTALLKLILSYCFFNNRPEDIPRQNAAGLFKHTVYIYAASWLIILSTLEDFIAAVLQTSIGFLLTLSYVGLVLAVSRRFHLFWQTSIAVIAVQPVFLAASFPLVIWVQLSEAGEILYPFYSIVFMGLWLIAVIAYLLKTSLSATRMSGSLMALGYFGAVFGSALALFA